MIIKVDCAIIIAITVAEGVRVTLRGVISGSGFIKRGGGVLILAADNTFTGQLEIYDGAVQIGEGGTTGSVAVDIDNRAMLIFSRSDDYTFSKSITGPNGSVTKYGSGKLIFSDGHGYTGETVIEYGTLEVQSFYSLLNSSSVTINNGRLDVSSGNYRINTLYGNENAEVMFGTRTLILSGGSFAGRFTGTGGVTKTGILPFTMSTSYSTATGTFRHEQGTVVFSGWEGDYYKAVGTTLTVVRNAYIGRSLTLEGGASNMDLRGPVPSRLQVNHGSLTVSGNNIMNITAIGSESVYPLILVYNGFNNSTEHFSLSGVTGTLSAAYQFYLWLTGPAFVPVTNITGVPATATAGVPLPLTGTVNPSNATSQTITWSMQNNGTTGATISGNTFNAATAGTATVRATIANGTAQGANYTQDFTITVSAGASSFVPVTGITGLPTTATVGIPLQLSGTVVPSNATNKNITWSIWDAVTTGATISGNTFNASGDGTAHVAATIANGIAPGIDYVQYFVITLNRGIAPITINTQAEWDLLSGSMASWSGNTVVLNRNVTGDLTLNNNTTTLIIEGNGNTITGRIFSPLNIPINLTLKNVTVNSAGNTGYASIHLYGGMLTTEGKVFLNGNYNPNSESPGSGIASWGDLTINADENATFTGGRAAVNTGAAVFVNYGNLTVNGSAKFVGGGAGVSIIGNGNLTVLSGSPSFTGGESTTGDVGAYIDGDLIISSTGSPTFTGSDGNGQTYHRGATIRGNLRISAGTPSFKGGSISATNVTSGYHAGEGARILGSVIISGNASPSFTGGNHPISGNGGFGVSLGDNNMTVSTSGTVTFTAGSNGFTGIWADDKTIDLSRLTGKLTATGQTTAIYLYTGSIIYPAGLARSLEYDGTSPSYTLTVGSGTSAEVLFAPDLKIYPNPFTDAVHIAGVDIETGRMPLLQVINSSGMTIHTQLITKPDEIIRLHHLPAGVYFFRVEKDGRVRTLKGVRVN